MFRPLHLRVRHLLFAVPLAAALLVAPATAASAAGPSADLTCTITFTSDINPPITPEGGPHSATTHGLTGTADCTGTVDGETVTGTGSFAFYSEGTVSLAAAVAPSSCRSRPPAGPRRSPEEPTSPTAPGSPPRSSPAI